MALTKHELQHYENQAQHFSVAEKTTALGGNFLTCYVGRWGIKLNCKWQYLVTVLHSGVGGGGVGGCKRTPKTLDLSKIWEKSLKIQAKSLKIWAKSLKIREKSLKIWAQSLKSRAQMAPNVVWFENMAPNVCRNTQKQHMKTFFLFFEAIPKKDFCGRKFVGKSRTYTFRASLGNFGQNPSHPQKFACSNTYVFTNIKNELQIHFRFSAESSRWSVTNVRPIVNDSELRWKAANTHWYFSARMADAGLYHR